MQTTEDILHVAHRLGIAQDVFDEVGRIKNLPEYKSMEYNHLYYQAYQNVIKQKNIHMTETLEHKTWESALIKSTTYDVINNTLSVEFNNEKVYEYKDFSAESYNEFLSAESKGKHFLSKIRSVYKDMPEKVSKLNKDE